MVFMDRLVKELNLVNLVLFLFDFWSLLNWVYVVIGVGCVC